MSFVLDQSEYTISLTERSSTEDNPAIAIMTLWSKKSKDIVKEKAFLFLCSIEEIEDEVTRLCIRVGLEKIEKRELSDISEKIHDWYKYSPFKFGFAYIDESAPNYLKGDGRGFISRNDYFL